MECEEHISVSGKITRKYYHKECLKMKNDRDEAVQIFYDYTKSYEPLKKVYDAFKRIKSKGINETQILYLIKYIRDNNKILNYPHGLLFYLDEAMKDYNKNKKLYQIDRVVKNEDDFIQVNHNQNERNDKMDISDFL